MSIRLCHESNREYHPVQLQCRRLFLFRFTSSSTSLNQTLSPATILVVLKCARRATRYRSKRSSYELLFQFHHHHQQQQARVYLAATAMEQNQNHLRRPLTKHHGYLQRHKKRTND
jgi:hypothetical protein